MLLVGWSLFSAVSYAKPPMSDAKLPLACKLYDDCNDILQNGMYDEFPAHVTPTCNAEWLADASAIQQQVKLNAQAGECLGVDIAQCLPNNLADLDSAGFWATLEGGPVARTTAAIERFNACAYKADSQQPLSENLIKAGYGEWCANNEEGTLMCQEDATYAGTAFLQQIFGEPSAAK
jgi:hypothetical protein